MSLPLLAQDGELIAYLYKTYKHKKSCLTLFNRIFFQLLTPHFLGKTNDILKKKERYICERFVTFKIFILAKIAKVLSCFPKRNQDVCKHFMH